MNNNTQYPAAPSRRVERIALLFVTAVLVTGFLCLNRNRNKQFEAVKKGYENKTVVNLNKDFSIDDLTNLLVNGNYISTPEDARTIATHISQKFDSGAKLPNLGALNKKDFFIKVSDIDSIAGNDLRNSIDKSRKALQIPENIAELDALYRSYHASDTTVGDGNCEISVSVYKKDTPVTDGVLIQLKEYWLITPDSLKKNEYADYDSTASIPRYIYFLSVVVFRSLVGFTPVFNLSQKPRRPAAFAFVDDLDRHRRTGYVRHPRTADRQYGGKRHGNGNIDWSCCLLYFFIRSYR